MKKAPKILVLFLLIGFHSIAQNQENRWVVGASLGVAKFTSEDQLFIGDQFNFQIPRLHATRYFFNGLSADVGIGFNTINEIPGVMTNSINYLSIDTGIKYDFGTSNDNLVPYFMFGGSLMKTTNKMTPTFNFGGGGTFWLNARYGVNLQLLYKSSMTTYQSMRSHTYFSVGMVYSLKLRTIVPRLWNKNGNF